MKNKTIQRIKKSRLGRLLCRIVGEDTGAVMMEYVLVAMLIAAATVAAVSYFGRDTQGMFGTLGRAIWGDSSGAQENRTQGMTDTVNNNTKAQQEGGNYSSLSSGAGTSGLGGGASSPSGGSTPAASPDGGE
jgi:Flp pilus assembly pilin Flp